MALPTLQDAKDYLRIDTTDEDALLTALLARSKSAIEVLIGYGMAASSVTFTDYGRVTASPWIQLPGPFALSPAPVVTDVDGAVVDATTYTLDQRAGKIRAKYNGNGISSRAGAIFCSSQYTVVATIGLSAHPDYAIRLESVASSAILDLTAHYYENRYPGISAEGNGGVSLNPDALPQRIQEAVISLPCVQLVA